MVDIKGLLEDIRDYNKKYTISEHSSDAEKLIAKMQDKDICTEQQYFDIEKEVKFFLKSNAPQTDKQKVLGYAESLSMIGAAIREGKLVIAKQKENDNG